MLREIINIDEEKCDGCGLCVPECHEGALQIIDDKAVLISDLMCDGLGACIGYCPQGALTIEKREAQPYDESEVMKEMIAKGKNVVIAHLKHLKDHGEHKFLKEGVNYLVQHKADCEFDPMEVIQEVHSYLGKKQEDIAKVIPVPAVAAEELNVAECGCPGARSMSFQQPGNNSSGQQVADQSSALTQWPVQMHLINPAAGYFQGADLLVSADCVAFSLGNFHSKHLQNKKLVIACPKLDSNQEAYLKKFVSLIDDAKVNTITVMIMEVPCCGGLLQMVQQAVSQASRKIPVKAVVVGIRGEVLQEDWV